jgi:hypothetical protein
MNRLSTLFIALSVVASAADKKKGAADPDLPQPVDAALAQPLLDNSPFTRELNLSDSLTLTGIAYIQGKPVATVFDKAKKTSYVVSEEPNAQGWKLAEASAAVAYNRSIAKIMVGNEVVTVRYSADQLSQDDKKNNRSPGSGGPPVSEGGPPRREYQRSPEDDERRRKFESLSDRAKEKVKDFFRDNREKMMNATPEERTAFIRQNFDRIQKEDSGGK